MTDTGNVQEWIKLIEVDWLGQYAKVWIAFNAWYREVFQSDGGRRIQDWKIIEKIKNDEQEICSTIESLLTEETPESSAFRANIGELHDSLAQTNIISGGRRISFEAIEDYQHAHDITETVNQITYKIEIDIPRRDPPRRIVVVMDSSDKEIFNQTIIREAENINLDETSFKSFLAQTKHSLSNSQQDTLRAFIQESSPIHNLLLADPNDNIKIGDFLLVNNKNLIARALIEILYQLRNSLFHGQIIPTSEVQKAYEPAYLILKRILLLVANGSAK